MRTIINFILFLLVCVLSYLLIMSIQGPIAFQEVYQERESAVIKRLEDHRTAQEAFRAITGEFTESYDTLKQILLNDSFKIEQVFGDKDAVGGEEAKINTFYVSAKDSLASLYGIAPSEVEARLDQLPFVPYGKTDTTRFEIWSDTMTYQKILVPVIRTHTTYRVFMYDYLDDKYRRYDSGFDPSKKIGYGDYRKPTTNGSW